jgi:hypothetical protein
MLVAAPTAAISSLNSADREVAASQVKAAVPISLVMTLAFPDPPAVRTERRPLTEADAVDIWVARWLRIRRRDLIRRYGCDPRRLYEIWEGARFPGSRARALELFCDRYPSLLDRVDFGPHRRIARTPHPDQLVLFESP